MTAPFHSLMLMQNPTMNSSASRLNCKVKIVIFGDTKEIPLYEYKDLFRSDPKAKW